MIRERMSTKPVMFINQLVWFVLLAASFWFFLFLCSSDYNYLGLTGRPSQAVFPPNVSFTATVATRVDPCAGRYIYIHHLPSRFNDDVMKNCTALIKWFNMCPYVTNMGLGPQVENPRGVLQKKGWFATNQFSLEVIFRERMKRYECLTNDSSSASAIFVPFYAGLDIGRHLWDYNTSTRDSLGIDLLSWLARQKEWKRMWGRDHLFVSGRIAWDLRREDDDESKWGSKLMMLPASMNMTLLSIETTSWSNEFAVPYPTYFHPASDGQVLRWQNRMRRHKRRYLFAFAGAPRPKLKESFRREIIKQCLASRRRCKFLECDTSGICENPVEVIKVFSESVFCLQPPGDSFTRRSTFDSILAGCIPVFFHPFSAYAQYTWYFPKNYSSYSVFIPGNLLRNGNGMKIIKRLRRVGKDRQRAMREEIIKLIPRMVYGDPRSKPETLEDAFDIAVKQVLRRIEKVRTKIEHGKDPSVGFAQENSWKLKLSSAGVQGQWDNFL